jgi:hypothetical protein
LVARLAPTALTQNAEAADIEKPQAEVEHAVAARSVRAKSFAADKRPVLQAILNEEMRKTAAAKAPDKKTGRLALLFCQQSFRINDARIVADRSVVAPNLDFDFTSELAVIALVDQMCQTYGLSMEIDKDKRNWIVTISRPNDHTFTAPADAASPILRRALLQAAIQAHSQYVKPYL